jgi:type II secretory pathway pseudopilin PulG
MRGEQSRQWRVASDEWRAVARKSESGGRRAEVGGRGTGDRGQDAEGGFSLVEVTVAIGIFAFVVVGVLGLLPTAMKLRAESAQETRAVMIAQEMFSSVYSSSSITNVILRDGPGLGSGNNQRLDLTKQMFVLGYPVQTAVPYWLFRNNAASAWSNMPTEAAVNNIETMAKLSATNVPDVPGLYQVTVEVRSPASIPLKFTKPTVFKTYFYSP